MTWIVMLIFWTGLVASLWMIFQRKTIAESAKNGAPAKSAPDAAPSFAI